MVKASTGAISSGSTPSTVSACPSASSPAATTQSHQQMLGLWMMS
jgi:hypothetical protein